MSILVGLQRSPSVWSRLLEWRVKCDYSLTQLPAAVGRRAPLLPPHWPSLAVLDPIFLFLSVPIAPFYNGGTRRTVAKTDSCVSDSALQSKKSCQSKTLGDPTDISVCWYYWSTSTYHRYICICVCVLRYEPILKLFFKAEKNKGWWFKMV